MFDHFCRSARPTVDADRLKSQAADVGAKLSDASSRAGLAATILARRAARQAKNAKVWAAPRVEKAWQEGVKVATPKVEQAAEKALPLVDLTHDRLVDDVLPRLLAAVNAAAAATAGGADKARDVASARLADLAHIVPEPPKKSHTGAKVFWSIAGLAVAGAVLAVFRRDRSSTDPWADEPWSEGEADLEASMEAAVGAPDTAADTTETATDDPGTTDAPEPEAVPAPRPATPRRRSTSRTATAGTSNGSAPKSPRTSPAAKAPKPAKPAEPAEPAEPEADAPTD